MGATEEEREDGRGHIPTDSGEREKSWGSSQSKLFRASSLGGGGEHPLVNESLEEKPKQRKVSILSLEGGGKIGPGGSVLTHAERGEKRISFRERKRGFRRNAIAALRR